MSPDCAPAGTTGPVKDLAKRFGQSCQSVHYAYAFLSLHVRCQDGYQWYLDGENATVVPLPPRRWVPCRRDKPKPIAVPPGSPGPVVKVKDKEGNETQARYARTEGTWIGLDGELLTMAIVAWKRL